MLQMPLYYDYNPKCAVKDRLFTPLSGVELKDSRFRQVFDCNRRFLHLLEMDRMTYWFDQKTGTPTQAEPYRGHFEDNLKGQTLSMFLMGAANALRWVEDESLRTKCEVLLERLRTAADPDGFLMPVDSKDFAWREYPHYVRIWLNYGLEAAALSVDPDVYDLLRRWQDWFNRCPDLPVIRYTELAFQGIVASTSVFFTPAGKQEDIAVNIEAYEEPWRLAQFMRREKDCVHIRRQPGLEPHAHGTETEAMEGYLDLYRATGRNYYLSAVEGMWELYTRDWQHAGGGIVMCEGMEKNYPGCRWLDPADHYNELCCTSFWLHLNQRLHRLFPDEEKYTAEVEKSLFNIAFADQQEDEGIRYFAFLEQKKQAPGLNHCCCGVGTRIYGSLPEYVYTVSETAVSVDLYTPSVLHWNGADIECTGNIPYEEAVTVKLTLPQPRQFELRLRIPGWTVSDVTVSVNGKEYAVGTPGSYLSLCREWQSGDTVAFRLPMDFRLTKYEGAAELKPFSRYALEYGPILYAVTAPTWEAARLIGWSVEDYRGWLIPTDTPLVYDLRQHPGFRLVPYMNVAEQAFTCYPVFTD